MLHVMQCDFVLQGGRPVCRRCGLQGPAGVAPERIHAQCRLRCVHQGESVQPIKVVCDCPETRLRQAEAAKCDVHKRCLPNWRPNAELLSEWRERPESSLYHLCHGCASFQAAQER